MNYIETTEALRECPVCITEPEDEIISVIESGVRCKCKSCGSVYKNGEVIATEPTYHQATIS